MFKADLRIIIIKKTVGFIYEFFDLYMSGYGPITRFFILIIYRHGDVVKCVIYKRTVSSHRATNCLGWKNFIVQVYAANVAAFDGNALKIVGVKPLKNKRQPSSRYDRVIQSINPLYLSGSD